MKFIYFKRRFSIKILHSCNMHRSLVARDVIVRLPLRIRRSHPMNNQCFFQRKLIHTHHQLQFYMHQVRFFPTLHRLLHPRQMQRIQLQTRIYPIVFHLIILMLGKCHHLHRPHFHDCQPVQMIAHYQRPILILIQNRLMEN